MLIFVLHISTFRSPLQPYVKANIFPLIYRGSNDPDRVKAGLAQTPISHFTQMVHADTEKVNAISKSTCYLITLSLLALIHVPWYFIDILQIGCGFVRTTTNIFVCNYSPPGNIIHNNVPLPAYEVIWNATFIFIFTDFSKISHLLT